MNRKLKNDIMIVAVLLICSAAWLFFSRSGASVRTGESVNVVITVDGEEVYRGPVSPADGKLRIDGKNGGYNVFMAERASDGSIGLRCLEADCPDKICVHTGLVTLPDEPIVCLPHRVSAHVTE